VPEQPVEIKEILRMRRLLLVMALLLATGCTMHTKAIRRDFADYNETLHYNNSQQMLLNLVRLKYRQTPFFMEVGALSASYDVSGNLEFGAGRISDAGVVNGRVGGSFSARPTITYTPLAGEMYVKRVLAEIDAETFILLVHSGWPIDILCKVMAERIMGFKNNEDEATYPTFLELVDVLARAQDEDRLRFLQEPDEDVVVEITTTRGDLFGGSRTDEPRPHLVEVKHFMFRSLLDLMFFLGKNTDVPEEQQDQVRSGTKNGWIQIRHHKNAPDDAMVAVKHNGYYFSIANNNIRSKDTFALLKLLFAIQAGDVETVQPILTLPVAGP
jgi:hypothetical protein